MSREVSCVVGNLVNLVETRRFTAEKTSRVQLTTSGGITNGSLFTREVYVSHIEKRASIQEWIGSIGKPETRSCLIISDSQHEKNPPNRLVDHIRLRRSAPQPHERALD